MAKIDLLPNEGILKQDSSIVHDRGGVFDAAGDELILTNLALLVVHKGTFGKVKNVQRFPLDQVRVVDGRPQVHPGASSEEMLQLQVCFTHGIESFTLGEPDGGFDDPELSLRGLLLSASGKAKKNEEKQYVASWCDAISGAVLGKPYEEDCSSQYGEAKRGSASAAHATNRCIGCRAPVSGVQGQRVVCSYCDTEQVIESGR